MVIRHPPKREEILTSFATLLDFNQLSGPTWVWEARLRRNLQQILHRYVDLKRGEEELVLCCLNGQEHEGRGHLIAYLQEPGYWAAWNLWTGLQRGNASQSWSLVDLFQIAMIQVDLVLKKFNPGFGANLQGYAFQVFKSKIRDALQSHGEMGRSSDWSLLRRTSQTALGSALHRAGYPKSTIQQLVLACRAYQLCYVPDQPQGTRRLEGPNPVTWQAILAFYNQACGEAQTTVEQLQTSLLNCARALREARPRFMSLDNQEESQPAWAELTTQPNQIEHLEEASLAQEIAGVLRSALAKLEPTKQELLRLYYQENLTQAQVAQRLKKNQVSVSRGLTQCRGEFIKVLNQWSQRRLNKTIDPNLSKTMGVVVDQWLTEQYGNPLGFREYGDV